jgi:hypothetical protein
MKEKKDISDWIGKRRYYWLSSWSLGKPADSLPNVSFWFAEYIHPSKVITNSNSNSKFYCH